MADNEDGISVRVVFGAAPDKIRILGKCLVGIVAVFAERVQIKDRKTEAVAAEDVIGISVVMGDHLAQRMLAVETVIA